MRDPNDRLDKDQGLSWQDRLRAALNSRCFISVTAYAAAHPKLSLKWLADNLGPAHIAPIQLQWALVSEAEASGAPESCARDLLVRELQDMPWPAGRGWDAQEDAILTLVGWQCCLKSPHHSAALDEIANALIDNVDIPAGWIPSGPDDPYIAAAFAQPSVVEAFKRSS